MMEPQKLLKIELMVTVRLKGRADEVFCPSTFIFGDEEALPNTVEELTDMASNYLNDKLDRRSVITLTFENRAHNKVIIPTKSIDSIFVAAPDKIEWYTEEF